MNVLYILGHLDEHKLEPKLETDKLRKLENLFPNFDLLLVNLIFILLELRQRQLLHYYLFVDQPHLIEFCLNSLLLCIKLLKVNIDLLSKVKEFIELFIEYLLLNFFFGIIIFFLLKNPLALEDCTHHFYSISVMLVTFK